MKSIEERAKEWAYRYLMTPDGYLTESDMRAVATNSYIQGTTEQKAIDEQVRLKKCDDMTQEQCDREAAFAEWYRENGKGTPTYSDAIEWARKETINKACEIVRNIANEYFGDWEQACKVEDTFRKAIDE